MKNGIMFNGKHSYGDFGLTIERIDLGFPIKNKVVEKVPFKNGEYDFSTILNGGEYDYANRIITVTFNVYTGKEKLSTKREELYARVGNIVSHFMESGKQILKLNEIKGYYFIADVSSISSFTEIIGNGKLDVEFECYPFMLKDTLTFFQGVNQGVKEYVLTNNGRPVTPIITVNIATAKLTMNGETITLKEGKHPLWLKRIPTGNTTIQVEGNCNITIEFREEKI